MNNPIFNSASQLRTSREFPETLRELTQEINKAYIDIAQSVNTRTVGVYSINGSSFTGNSYFLTPKRQSSLRRVYSFTGTGDIDLGFKLSSIQTFALLTGTYRSVTGGLAEINGLIAGTSVAIAGQISFYTTEVASAKSDVIRFVLGAGAPALVSGIIIVEWIANA